MIDNLHFALEGGFKVLWVGLLLGAGLPLLFALGVRSLVPASERTGDGTSTSSAPSAGGRAVAALCFALVVAGVALGLAIIVASGFGKVVSFEHVYPTFAPKP